MSDRFVANCVLCPFVVSSVRMQTMQDALMDHVIECHPHVNIRPRCETPVIEPPNNERPQ